MSKVGTLIAKVFQIGDLGRNIFKYDYLKIGDMFIDISLKEEIKFKSSITNNPVEDGYFVTDHRIKENTIIEVSGAISDNTVDIIDEGRQLLGLFQGNIFDNLKDKYFGISRKQLAAYQVLKNLHESGQAVDIVLKYDTFKNLIIESCNIPLDKMNQGLMNFTMTLKEPIIANVKTVEFSKLPDNLKDNIGSKVNLGSQDSLQATDIQTQKGKTRAKAMLDAVTGFIN